MTGDASGAVGTKALLFVPDGPGDLGPTLERLCRGPWSVGAPEVVRLDGEGEQPDVLAVLWELPEPGRVDLPIEVALYWDARELVSRFAELTGDGSIGVEVAYDEEVIGFMAHGSVDRGISEGLLGEWARALAARGAL